MICLYCHRQYPPSKKVKYAPYCTFECQSNHLKYHRTCPCGKNFIPKTSYQKYCSKDCQKEENNKQREAYSYRTIRFEIFKRDGFKCVYCGRESSDGAKLMVDHVYPRALGGCNHPENLATACEECNSGKSDRPISEADIVRIWSKNVVKNQRLSTPYEKLMNDFKKYWKS